MVFQIILEITVYLSVAAESSSPKSTDAGHFEGGGIFCLARRVEGVADFQRLEMKYDKT